MPRTRKQTTTHVATADGQEVAIRTDTLIEYEWPVGSAEYYFVQVSLFSNQDPFCLFTSLGASSRCFVYKVVQTKIPGLSKTSNRKRRTNTFDGATQHP